MHKINYYNKKFQDLKEQGSNEWLEGRKYSFGGSEIGVVLGLNKKYETFEELINNKINKLNKVEDATIWGSLFELVSKKFICKKYGYIFNYGSVPHPYYPVAYSPDGIILTEDEKDIVLLEIKNPFMRSVDKIPEHYKYQVQTGMNIFNVRHCLFAQFRFRRCPLKTFPDSDIYDRKYHKEYRKRCPDKLPIAFGYLYWNIDCELLDLSQFDVMSDHINKNDKHEIIINIKRKFKKGKVLMWKLFEIKYDIIEKDKDFLKNYEEELWDKYKILNDKNIEQKS